MAMARAGSPGKVEVIEESYDAVLIINRTKIIKKANERGFFDDPAQTTKGVLTKVEIATTDLDAIKLRLKQHIDLVED